MFRLATQRLRLRPFLPGDVAGVHSYAADAEVCRYMDWGPNTLAQTRAFVQDMVAAASSAEQASFTWASDGGPSL